jgi:hypothetical protein
MSVRICLFWGGVIQCAHRRGILLLVLCVAASASAAQDSSLPMVIAYDNRTPAGQLVNGVLKLHLELRPRRWYPEDERGVYRDVDTFAEQGHASHLLIRCILNESGRKYDHRLRFMTTASVTCPQCGASDGSGCIFCEKCGAALQTPAPLVVSDSGTPVGMCTLKRATIVVVKGIGPNCCGRV